MNRQRGKQTRACRGHPTDTFGGTDPKPTFEAETVEQELRPVRFSLFPFTKNALGSQPVDDVLGVFGDPPGALCPERPIG